jgi:hypothetical protein
MASVNAELEICIVPLPLVELLAVVASVVVVVAVVVPAVPVQPVAIMTTSTRYLMSPT